MPPKRSQTGGGGGTAALGLKDIVDKFGWAKLVSYYNRDSWPKALDKELEKHDISYDKLYNWIRRTLKSHNNSRPLAVAPKQVAEIKEEKKQARAEILNQIKSELHQGKIASTSSSEQLHKLKTPSASSSSLHRLPPPSRPPPARPVMAPRFNFPQILNQVKSELHKGKITSTSSSERLHKLKTQAPSALSSSFHGFPPSARPAPPSRPPPARPTMAPRFNFPAPPEHALLAHNVAKGAWKAYHDYQEPSDAPAPEAPSNSSSSNGNNHLAAIQKGFKLRSVKNNELAGPASATSSREGMNGVFNRIHIRQPVEKRKFKVEDEWGDGFMARKRYSDHYEQRSGFRRKRGNSAQ